MAIDECKVNIYFVLALFLVSTNSWGKCQAHWLLKAPLGSSATRELCLFAVWCWAGSVQKVYMAVSLKWLQNCKVAGQTANNELSYKAL